MATQSPRKPPRPANTSGNRYTSRPPKKLKLKPILRDPGPNWTPERLRALGYRKAGSKTGKNVWALPRSLRSIAPGTPGGPAGPAAPKPPPDPYAKYPEWARMGLRQRDADIENTQKFGLEVQKWLSGQLAPIQAAGQAATQNYRNSIAALPMPGAAGGIPPVVGAGGGAVTGSPDAWKMSAANTAQLGYSTAQQGQGAIASFLADSGLGNLRSQLEANLAAQLLKIPEEQKREKREYLAKLDEFMASQAAEQAQFEAELARDTTNDWYDLVAQLTNAGVRLEDIRMDGQGGSGGVVVTSRTKPTTPGYTWYREGPNKWRGIEIPGSGSSGSSTGTRPTGLIGPVEPNTPVPDGYVKVRSGGKTYWRALGGGSGGSGGSGGVSPEQRRLQVSEARDIWRGDKGTSVSGQTVYTGGLKDGVVTGYTDSRGKLLDPSGIKQRYVNNVRFYRFDEALSAIMSPQRVAEVMRSVIGGSNFSRYVKWANNTKATGPYSLKQAKRRRHI